MLRTVGLIVEYNPLHNGHVYHYQQSKRLSAADAVIAVMSGNWLQRGEPALVNKWARAEMALRMGADLVLELPVAFSSQPAEWFAYGAVSALDATGACDALCFGSESGDAAALQAAARRAAREPAELQEAVRRRLKAGVSYPAAYAAALDELLQREGAGAPELTQPNNILGLHYSIALERLGSRIVPLTIARRSAGYHQSDITDASIASATALRRILFESGDLTALAPYAPESTVDILVREMEAGRGPNRWAGYARPLLLKLLQQPAEELALHAEVTEGLEHRLKRAALAADLTEDDPVQALLAALKTKRYTHVKLQRTLTRLLLGHTKPMLAADTLRQGVPYLRVLGFTGRGQELLAGMRKTAKVPVLTKVKRGIHPFLDLDIDATSIYALGYPRPTPRDLQRDYVEPPVRL